MSNKLSKTTIKALKAYSTEIKAHLKELKPLIDKVTLDLKVAQEAYDSAMARQSGLTDLHKALDSDIKEQEKPE